MSFLSMTSQKCQIKFWTLLDVLFWHFLIFLNFSISIKTKFSYFKNSEIRNIEIKNTISYTNLTFKPSYDINLKF